jgi:hypothetical protein
MHLALIPLILILKNKSWMAKKQCIYHLKPKAPFRPDSLFNRTEGQLFEIILN